MADEKKYWDKESETIPLDKLRALQEERLQEIVYYAYNNSKFYRQKFDSAGITPNHIKALDDLSKIPLTTDQELRHTPMEDKLTVPFHEVRHVCSTSGTTELAEPIPLTQEDFMKGCVFNLLRGKYSMGLRPSDSVQHLAGFACHSRINESLGATTIKDHVGRGNLDQQILLGNMMNITALEHLPSMVLRYFERAEELGVDIANSKLRLILALGEGWAEAYKHKVETQYNVTFRSLYGLTEAGELAAQCDSGIGMHILSDSHLIEVIDPKTLEVLSPGEEGEIVVTNFFRKAVPRIRYRTSDIAKILPYEPCSCGRTFPKMSMVRGREANILNVEGKKIFPIDVEEVLGRIPELGYEYQIILTKPGEQEHLAIKVEHHPEVKNRTELKERVELELKELFGIASNVEIVPKGSIGRAMFKAQRVVKGF